MSYKTEINQKYEVLVPAEVRKALRLRPGDHLLVDVRDGAIVLVPERSDAVEQLRGLYRELWGDTDANAYVDQERNTWETS